MSAPQDKATYPPEFAADLHKLDVIAAARLLREPSNLAELSSAEFLEIYKAVTDFRWNDPQHNLSADDERDPDDLRDLNEDNPERDYPLTLDGRP